MDDTFYNGHDVLYHHAKFGEDRTTRAGCRCENVVFVTMFVTGRMPRSGNLPVLFLLSSQKSIFCPRAEKLWIRSKNVWHLLWWARRALPSCKVWGRSDNARRLEVRKCRVCFFCSLPIALPRSGKLPVLFLLTGQKSGFSPRRGDSLHRFRSNFAWPTGTGVRLAAQNFTSIGNAAPKYQKCSLFGKESPGRGDSLDRFRQFLGAFMRLIILR